MKKIHTILSIGLLGIVILVLSNPKISGCIDDVLLLEKRHPGYYDYLSKSSIYYVSKDALKEPNANLLTNVMQTSDFSESGFKIQVHEDGSFTFSGTYTGEDPTYLYPLETGNLKSGDYILSDGNASIANGIQLRIFGVRDLPDGSREYGNCVQLPGDGSFHWDQDEYDRAMMDVMLYPGFSAENLRFYPMLVAADNGELSYQNAIRKLPNLSEDQHSDDYVTYMEIQIDKKSVNQLKKTDWQILCHETKYQKNVNWVCVDFGNGTGLQITDDNLDNAIYGELDTVGRVKNKIDY